MTSSVNSSLPALATPLGEEKNALLRRLMEGLDAASLTWLSGYFAGLAARQLPATLPAAPPEAAQAAPQGTLTLIYGTQTGNSRMLAERLKQRAEAAGLSVRSFRASDYPVRELKNERFLYVVISTQGDGDPPDDARGFFEFLRGKRAPALGQLRFAVLGLGDSSYPKFCEMGRVLDERFAELGATRLLARAECDVDFEPVAEPWLAQALEVAKKELVPEPSLATITPLRGVAEVAPTFSRDNPYPSLVLGNQRITGRGALKDVRHMELSLEGSGLTYEPGDALGVIPRNPPELVEAVLSESRLEGDTEVSHDGRVLPLKRWLTEELELTRLSRPFLASHATRAKGTELQRLLTPEGGEALRELLASHQIIDVLRQHPGTWSAQELVGALRRLTPRLYSIASSQKRVGEEVHLTLGVVDYEAFGTRHMGAASYYLATREAGQDTVGVFIEANERFRLPKDASRDIIMVGPGTGVAPFRAFVQERAETGASGRNWLFFGEQHFRTQFLYQVEWQEAVKRGTLHRLDLAFSRDQGQKVYVQDRLREKGRDVYAWLEGGASLYVCGDAKRMAPDVDAALVDIISAHGGKSREDAKAHLESLREQQRYLRDVY